VLGSFAWPSPVCLVRTCASTRATHECVCVCARARVCLCACAHACLPAFVRVCPCVRVRVRVCVRVLGVVGCICVAYMRVYVCWVRAQGGGEGGAGAGYLQSHDPDWIWYFGIVVRAQGLMAVNVVYPFDVVRRRMQTHEGCSVLCMSRKPKPQTLDPEL